MPEKKKAGRIIIKGFVAWTFAIALGLLFFLVLRTISAQITPPPQTRDEPYPDVSTQQLCENAGGRWIEQGAPVKGEIATRPVTDVNQPYCQGPLAFERQDQLQRERNQQTELFVFAFGGALAIAGALMLRVMHPVAPGLMLGAIAAFVRAGFHVWTLAPGIGRLLTILVVFGVVVYVGMRVFKDDKK